MICRSGFQQVPLHNPVHSGHDTDDELHADPISYLNARLERFATNARDARLAVGLIVEQVVEVVRQLTMNADRLHLVQDRVTRASEHGGLLWLSGFGLSRRSWRRRSFRLQDSGL